MIQVLQDFTQAHLLECYQKYYVKLIKDWLYIGGNIYDRFSGMYKKKSTKEPIDTTDSLLGNASVSFAPKDSGI